MRRVSWFTATGEELPLNLGESYAVLGPNASFAGTPPVRATLDQVPLQPGSRWRYADHGERELALPVTVMAATSADLEVAYDAFASAFDPTRGDGRLRVTRSNGEVRELVCRLVDTMSIVEPYGDVTEWPAVLVLRAADPYYTDISDSSITLRSAMYVPDETYTTAQRFNETIGFDEPIPFSGTVTGGPAAENGTEFNETTAFNEAIPFSGVVPIAPGGGQLFFPFFPLRLGASETFATFSVNNTGHVATWPVWVISGPATIISIVSDTTGERFELAAPLAPGETLTIDTRPGRKVIVNQAGETVFPITGDSSLFPLLAGSNHISVEIAGSAAATSVVARWRRRWLTA